MAHQLVIADQTRRSRGTMGCLGVLFGLIVASFSAPLWVTFAIDLSHGTPTRTLAIPGLAGVLCSLPGLALVTFGIHNVRLSRLVGVSTLTMPRAEPLCLGGAVTAWFHRVGPTASVAATPALSAELACHELVTYQQGTGDHTVSRELYRQPLPMTLDQVSGQLSGYVSVEVPVDLPPSLSLPHNKVMWTVQVQVRVPGAPKDKGTFEVTVLPVVAARLLGDAGADDWIAGVAP